MNRDKGIDLLQFWKYSQNARVSVSTLELASLVEPRSRRDSSLSVEYVVRCIN